MPELLLIAVAGLALALVAALFVIRRRTDEIEALAAAATAVRAGAGSAPAPLKPAGPDLPDDILPVGLMSLGADRRVERANARAHALLEIAPGRLVGRSVMEAFLDARVAELVDQVPDRGSATGEARVGTRDPRTVSLRVHRPPGNRTWIIIEDVSELRRLQQIRAEFIDNLSHELRTPLSTVSLLAETLARDAESAEVPARMKERIAKVEVETGHLVQMVNELLDLAKIEGGTETRLDEDVDLGRLAVASAERLRLFAERQGVQLVVRASAGAPPVRGDEDRLGQVFVNLVHNAVKFSPDGGEVAIDVRADGGEVVASVTDHGIGISKRDRPRIFERFYKADRARVRGGGTGLGLAIARHVVERHGGRIWVESEEGSGSTFSFAIPVAGAGDSPPEPSAAEHA